jgi:hypothetical protein
VLLFLPQACSGTGQGRCPAQDAVKSSDLRISSCSGGTATITYYTNLPNGQCQAVPLQGVTLAAFAPGASTADRCAKAPRAAAAGGLTAYSSTVTLTGVPCGSRIAVYAQDSSYSSSGNVGVNLAGVLPQACRDDSIANGNNCGPMGSFIVQCEVCQLVPASRRLSRHMRF